VYVLVTDRDAGVAAESVLALDAATGRPSPWLPVPLAQPLTCTTQLVVAGTAGQVHGHGVQLPGTVSEQGVQQEEREHQESVAYAAFLDRAVGQLPKQEGAVSTTYLLRGSLSACIGSSLHMNC
jgi:hypothetical protein